MKQLSFLLSLSIFNFIFYSCSSKTVKKENTENYAKYSSSQSCYRNNMNDEDENQDASSSCKIEDGTYSATIDYNNPETGYSNTYNLDVVVENCQVIQINFPNGGCLDDDHIVAGDIDEDGNASVSGENGKTYEVHIDN